MANLAAHTVVHGFQYTKRDYYIIIVLIDLIKLYRRQYSIGAQACIYDSVCNA